METDTTFKTSTSELITKLVRLVKIDMVDADAFNVSYADDMGDTTLVVSILENNKPGVKTHVYHLDVSKLESLTDIASLPPNCMAWENILLYKGDGEDLPTDLPIKRLNTCVDYLPVRYECKDTDNGNFPNYMNVSLMRSVAAQLLRAMDPAVYKRSKLKFEIACEKVHDFEADETKWELNTIFNSIPVSKTHIRAKETTTSDEHGCTLEKDILSLLEKTDLSTVIIMSGKIVEVRGDDISLDVGAVSELQSLVDTNDKNFTCVAFSVNGRWEIRATPSKS